MTTFRIAAGLAVAIGLTTTGLAGCPTREVGRQEYDKGSEITLQGCVIAGDKKDTYVLGRVQEWPAGESDMGKHGRRMYWIHKKADDLKAHLGHLVQLSGKITDVKKSEIEMEDVKKGVGQVVEIEGPGDNVKTSAANAGVAAGHSTEDIPITLLMLKVEELKMIPAPAP